MYQSMFAGAAGGLATVNELSTFGFYDGVICPR